MKLQILVPKAATYIRSIVAPGSAVVGYPSPREPGTLHVYYEGAVLGQQMGFSDKLNHAAGRAAFRAPTSARAYALADEFDVVGTYDGSRGAVEELSDPELLERWSGTPVAEIVGERLDAGPVAWADAARVCAHEAGARPVGRQRLGAAPLCFRTKAGQVVEFRGNQATVHEHDDPGTRQVLEGSGADEREIYLALGTPAAEDPVVSRGP